MSFEFINSVVSIRKLGKRGIAGTGFVISESGLIVTCRHVLDSSKTSDNKVNVRFKSAKKNYKASIIVVGNKNLVYDDIAILRLDSRLPNGVQALKLSHSGRSLGHAIETYGFPETNPIEGFSESGYISGNAGENNELLHLKSNGVTIGFSGAPVWDVSRKSVIGFVVGILPEDKYGKLGDSAFAIPIESITKYCSEIAIESIPEEYEELLSACKMEHSLEIKAIGAKYIYSLFVPRDGLDGNFKNFLENIEQTKEENLRIRERNKEIEEDNKEIREKNRYRSRDEQIPVKKFLDETKIFNCLLFMGEAGIGKTNQLCHITEKYGDDYPIIFFSGGRILLSDSYSIKDKISEDLKNVYDGLPSYDLNDIEKIVKRQNKYLIIIIDAINECLTPRPLIIHLSNLISQYKEKNIAFIISCRDIDWRFFEDETPIVDSIYMAKGMDWQSRKGTILKEFNDDEFNEAWALYKNHFKLKGALANTSDIKRICKQPIMLRFLAEAYEGDCIPEKDIKRIEIFNRYWDKKLSSTREKRSAQEFLYTIVSYMIKKEKVELLEYTVEEITQQNADDPQATFTKILSENIIIYKDIDKNTKEYKIGFTYEAFFEYVIARRFLLKHDGFDEKLIIHDFIKMIEKIPNYRNYMGAIEYIILLYEELDQDIYTDLIDEFVNCVQYRDVSMSIINKLKNFLKIKKVFLKLADDDREELNHFTFSIFIKNLNKFSIQYQTYMFEMLSTRTNRKFRGQPISYILKNYKWLPFEQKNLILSLSRSNNWTKTSIIQQINAIHTTINLKSKFKPVLPISMLENIILEISTSEDILIQKEIIDFLSYSFNSISRRKFGKIIDCLIENKCVDYNYFNSILFSKIYSQLPLKQVRKIFSFYIENGDSILRANTVYMINGMMQGRVFTSEDLDETIKILLKDADATVSRLAEEIFKSKINYWFVPLKERDLKDIDLKTDKVIAGFGKSTQVYKMKAQDEICFYIKGKGIIGNAKLYSNPEIEYYEEESDNYSRYYTYRRDFTWNLRFNEFKIYLHNPVVIDSAIIGKLDMYKNFYKSRGFFFSSIRQLSQKDFDILTKKDNR